MNEVNRYLYYSISIKIKVKLKLLYPKMSSNEKYIENNIQNNYI